MIVECVTFDWLIALGSPLGCIEAIHIITENR